MQAAHTDFQIKSNEKIWHSASAYWILASDVANIASYLREHTKKKSYLIVLRSHNAIAHSELQCSLTSGDAYYLKVLTRFC